MRLDNSANLLPHTMCSNTNCIGQGVWIRLQEDCTIQGEPRAESARLRRDAERDKECMITKMICGEPADRMGMGKAKMDL